MNNDHIYILLRRRSGTHGAALEYPIYSYNCFAEADKAKRHYDKSISNAAHRVMRVPFIQRDNFTGIVL
jgi:hypothetical protein